MIRAACVALFIGMIGIPAHAQTIYGSSAINIDPSANLGTADCETDLDSSADDGYTAARVTCYVTDENNNTVASGAYSDEGDEYGYAEVSLTFTANPGSTYTVTAGHEAVFTVPFDEPDGGYPLYYDEYNFENYIESPDQDLADSYAWYGPGPEQQTRRQSKTLPPTVAKKHYPKATISIAFTGQKNSLDQISLTNDARVCSQSLGPQDCSSSTGWWHWSLEGSFQVSDDVANWTVKQSASTVSWSGVDTDLSGNVKNFSVSCCAQPSDGPSPAFLQQTAGATTGFWTDSPGLRSNVTPDGGSAYISLDYIQHFTVNVCSIPMPGVCATKSWNVHLKTDANGQLSATNSSAGYE